MNELSTPVRYAGLAADDTGGDDRPAIVLLHGLTFDRRTWTPVVDRVRALDPDRRVVAFDLPGHGESAAHLPHTFDHLVALFEEAFDDAGVHAPLLVGHSMSGGLASLYGAGHPLTGIVNVDQPPDLEPFARLVASMQERLQGPEFDGLWQTVFKASFHLELLPDSARSLVDDTSAPSQEKVLSYWHELTGTPPLQLGAMVDRCLDAISQRSTPYLLVMGSPIPAATEARVRSHLPAMVVHDWSPSGHFPHLAHVDRFAELLVGLGR